MGGTQTLPSLSWSDADQTQAPPPPEPAPPPPAARPAAALPKKKAAEPKEEFDWSTAEAPKAAPAAPSTTQQTAAPSAEFDWSTAQTPKVGAIENFARNFNETLTGGQDLGQLVSQVKDLFADPYYWDDPAKAQWEIVKQMHAGMKQVWDQAEDEWNAGNFTTARGLMSRADSLYDFVMSGIPFGGTALSKAGKQISSGDISGGLGTAAGVIGPMVTGDVGTGIYKGPEGFQAPPLGAELRQGARNVVAEHGEDIGQIVGGVGGFAKTGTASGALGGYILGGKIGRILQERAARVPDAPTTSDLAGVIKQTYGDNIPVSAAAVPASIYNEIRKANMDLSDTQIRGIAEDLLGPEWKAQQAAEQARRASRPAPPEAPGETPAAPPETSPEAPWRGGGTTISWEPGPAPPEAPPARPAAAPAEEAPRPAAEAPPAEAPAAARPAAAAEEPAAEAPPEHAPWGGPAGAEVPLGKLDQDINLRYSQNLSDNQMIAQLRDDMAHTASGLETEIERERFERERAAGAAGATKGMQTTVLGALQRGEEPPAWTQMPNWQDLGRDGTRVLTGSYGPPPLEESAIRRALSGADNRFVTQAQYEDAVAAWREAMGGSKMMIPGMPPPSALGPLAEIGVFHLERLARAGKVGFQNWSEAMVKEFGDEIEPALSKLYAQITEGLHSALQISTRNPTGKNPTIDPLAENFVIDRAAIDNAQPSKGQTMPEKIADRLANEIDERTRERVYTGFKVDPKWTAKQTLDAFTKHLSDNLVWLHNQVPEAIRAVTARWYDSARRLAFEMADKYGYATHQMAGVIAALSPQLDWNVNLSLADRITDIWTNQRDTQTTARMISKAKELADKAATAAEKKPTPDRIQFAKDMAKLPRKFMGKTLADIKDPVEQAWWVRIYDEAENPRSYDNYTPDGESMGPARTTKGALATAAWNVPADNIAKAISILQDDSRENISSQLGNAHKVRNFYNNLVAPNDPAGHVTMDTHAVAAANLQPLAGEDTMVTHNLSGPPGASNDGVTGFYGIYADAYRMAAKKLGIQPRQLQSITWEAARDLFPEDFKGNLANKDIITDIWKEYEDGDLTATQARQKIVKTTNQAIKGRERLGAKLPTPEWVRWKAAQTQ